MARFPPLLSTKSLILYYNSLRLRLLPLFPFLRDSLGSAMTFLFPSGRDRIVR